MCAFYRPIVYAQYDVRFKNQYNKIVTAMLMAAEVTASSPVSTRIKRPIHLTYNIVFCL